MYDTLLRHQFVQKEFGTLFELGEFIAILLTKCLLPIKGVVNMCGTVLSNRRFNRGLSSFYSLDIFCQGCRPRV